MKVDDRWATEASSQFAVYVAVEKSDEPIAKTETAEEESAPPATAVADASAESVATATLVADVTEEKGSAADVKGTREAAVEGEGEKKATKKQAHHPIMKRSKRGQRAGGKGAKAGVYRTNLLCFTCDPPVRTLISLSFIWHIALR